MRYINHKGDRLINSSRRSQKRFLRRATPTHSHSVYNICFTRGDRIPWIAEISDAIDLPDAYEMR
ncbi:hypothetical protein HUN01_26995 [Nostoc edaphicum CCNP1411]|uniref:Uncharacterized protein n=1 Tax=Nostoc edaphicum CCNP1411 TaxID=1472755 RepID=A0A7D7QB01_9NOSO|nr:hypothetical protein [Nostoc edaphicum]QMS91055.1 hypothetical protein HUN01_26995 [Nostoc edaphicum CCNP1411]